jgi:pimeloyl-ACP methyl ester carboxylesterase
MIDTTQSAAVLALGPGATLRYFVDDYTDPWHRPDIVLMLHGIAEQAVIWRPWVPHFARSYRVVRPDLRGFGGSSPLPADRPFTLADWADDIEELIATLGGRRVHLVATKLGALIAFELAQRRHPWIASMSLAGMLASPSNSLGGWINEWIALVENEGVESWARATMPGRMGDNLSPAATAWWTRLMGMAPAASVTHCFRLLPGIEGPPNPDRVDCPTLFLAAAGDGFVAGAYNQRPLPSDLRRLQQRVPRSELVSIEANSYHIAATHPDLCAQRVLDFITKLGADAR